MAASPIFMDHQLPMPISGASSAHSRSASSPLHFLESDNGDGTMFLQEDDTCYLLSVEMPGINGNDLEVSLVDTTLIIGGYRRSSGSSNRKRQRIRRTLEIDPQAMDVHRAIARVWNGYLTLYAPKKFKHTAATCIVEEPEEDTSATSLEWDSLYQF
jgi:HSP20 family molecular chaperone IbpA